MISCKTVSRISEIWQTPLHQIMKRVTHRTRFWRTGYLKHRYAYLIKAVTHIVCRSSGYRRPLTPNTLLCNSLLYHVYA